MAFEINLEQQLLFLITQLGVLQGFILAAVVLFYPKRDKNSNNLLALFIATAAIILMAPIIQLLIGWRYVWILHGLKFFTIISLYLYIKSLSQTITFANSWKHFLIIPLYTPVAYHFVHYIYNKYGEDNAVVSVNDPYTIAISVFNLAYLAGYLFLNIRAYQEHKRKVEKNFSESNRFGLQWIKQLITGYVIIVVVSSVIYGFMLNQPELATWGCLINIVLITAFLYFVTIKGKLSPEIYQLKKLLLEESSTSAPATSYHPPFLQTGRGRKTESSLSSLSG